MGTADAEGELASLLCRAAAIPDLEDDGRWAIIGELHRRTDRSAFDAVRDLVRSARVRDRVLAVDILAQIGYPAGRPFAADTLPLLIAASQDEHEEVIAAAVAALGHLADPRALPAVLSHVGHPSAEVRFAVAAALPAAAGDPPSQHVITALIALSADPDSDVRDWATFGLGTQLEQQDSDVIRDALAARLDDSDDDTRGEALTGLARRRDARALPVLLARLDDDPSTLVVEAAAALAAPAVLPALERLKRDGWHTRHPLPSVLDDALRACTTDATNDGTASSCPPA